MSSLDLVSGIRPDGAVGRDGQRADRHFMEFVIDGEKLGRVLGPFLGYGDVTEEYVPVLVTDWPTGIAMDDLDRLAGVGSTAELAGRTALYICAECGDLGCGAVTALIEIDGPAATNWDSRGPYAQTISTPRPRTPLTSRTRLSARATLR